MKKTISKPVVTLQAPFQTNQIIVKRCLVAVGDAAVADHREVVAVEVVEDSVGR